MRIIGLICKYQKTDWKHIHNQNMKCFIRFKPEIVTEIDLLLENDKIAPDYNTSDDDRDGSNDHGVYISGNEVFIQYKDDRRYMADNNVYQHEFDGMIDGDVDQQLVYYQCAGPVIEGVLDGYNATIFAYGGDDNGKTYTMLGNHDEYGIAQRCIIDLYTRLQRKLDEGDIDGFRLKYHGVWIHGKTKKMMDLFEEDDFTIKYSIKPGFGEEQGGGLCTFVDGVKQFEIDNDNLQEVMRHINKFTIYQDDYGHYVDDGNRDIILMIDVIQIIDNDGSGEWITSQLKLVKCKASKPKPTMTDYDMYDLLEDHDYTTRRMYKEVPFNHLLSDSFNGNRISVMIGCCSKDLNVIQDTIGTLKFAEGVMEIKNDKLDNSGNIRPWWQLYIQPSLNIIEPLKLMVDPMMRFREIKYEIDHRTTLNYDEIRLKENLETIFELDDEQRLIDNKNIAMGGTIYLFTKTDALEFQITVTDVDDVTTPLSPLSVATRSPITAGSLLGYGNTGNQ